MISKLVYLLPAFLSVVTGTRLPVSAGVPIDVSSTRELNARAVEPMLDFSGSTWIWTGEQNGTANDDAPVGVRPFRKAIPSSSTKCLVCATIIISCDDSYSIVVNGKEIGAGNGYHTPAVYTVGLEPEGHNVFAIAVNNIGGAVICGKVIITADDQYILYVNGNNIGNGSNWGSMQAYSIPILDTDENLIAVDSVNTQPTVAGLIAGVLVAYNDGTSETYYTDGSWKTLAATSPAGFEATDLDDSSWMSAKMWMHGGSPTVPPA